METCLSIHNLGKTYQNFSLKNVSFELPRGYVMGFVGPNGAGKTTTIKLIMNLIQRNDGTINVFGKDLLVDEQAIKQKIGFVSDSNFYYENWTVDAARRAIRRFYAGWNDPLFEAYLERFNLPGNKKIKDLSRGMKTKFSLAIALSHNAELLILDEPTSGLDPVVRSELLDILRDYVQDERHGVLFSTHITSDLEKIADYITFILDGRVIFSLTYDEILEKHRLIKGGLDELDRSLQERCIGLRRNQFGFEALVPLAESSLFLQDSNLIVEKPTLEDIIIHYAKSAT